MCEKYRELMSSYIDNKLSLDNELSEAEKIDFERHLASCPSCERELAENVEMLKALRELPQMELPEDFHAHFMARLAREKSEEKNIFKALSGMSGGRNFNYRAFVNAAAAFALTFILLSAVLSGIGGISDGTSDYGGGRYGNGQADAYPAEGSYEPAAEAAAAPAEAAPAAEAAPKIILSRAYEPAQEGAYDVDVAGQIPNADQAAEAAETSDLIIRQLYIDIEADDPAQVIANIDAMPGDTVSMRSRNRGDYISNSISKRIYNADYESFIETLGTLGEVVGQTESSNKVNGVVNELNLTSDRKEEERERLLELMAETDDITSLIAIEERLNAIEDELDSFKTRQRHYSTETAATLVDINVIEKGEAQVYNPPLARRVADTFAASANMTIGFMEDCLTFVSFAILPLIFLAVIVAAVILFNKKRKDRR